MRESSIGEPVKSQRPSEETRQAEQLGDEGNSSDDCAWSVNSEVGDAGEKIQDGIVSSDQGSGVARELEQRRVATGDPSHQSCGEKQVGEETWMSLRSWLPSQRNFLRQKKKSKHAKKKSDTRASAHNPHSSLSVRIAIHITMANSITDRMKTLADNTNALATDLTALLDRFIFLEGCTLNAHPIQPQTILPPLPTDDTPIAVQMYATLSLSDHLDAHDRELEEVAVLQTRIATLTDLPSVLDTADKILDNEFATALTNSQNLNFPSLAAKLATLRNLQHHVASPRPQEFKTYIVTATNDAGSADPFTTIYLPVTIDWVGYAEILTEHTRHPKTTADGFPDGYTLKEGKWLYQRIVKGRREEKFCELGCEKKFRGMRREMRREGFGVLVWHVSRPWRGYVLLVS